MAEFLGNVPTGPLEGMSLMGHPIDAARRQRGFDHAKKIGLDTAHAFDCINGMCEAYERDKPYEAQEHSMKYVDLTGHYRLMAAILA